MTDDLKKALYDTGKEICKKCSAWIRDMPKGTRDQLALFGCEGLCRQCCVKEIQKPRSRAAHFGNPLVYSTEDDNE